MSENSNIEKNTIPPIVCPFCGKEYQSIHEYASHINYHSKTEKEREEKERKQKLADQKKVDIARLNKLRNAYLNASEAYTQAKEQFMETHGEPYVDWGDIFKNLQGLESHNCNWRSWF